MPFKTAEGLGKMCSQAAVMQAWRRLVVLPAREQQQQQQENNNHCCAGVLIKPSDDVSI